MNTLIVGASGATGRLLVKDLLQRGEKVTVVVRSTEKLSELLNNENLTVVEAAVLDLSNEELVELVRGCDAVASCLGHNITFKGLFGHPRRLVTDATRRLCAAIEAGKPQKPVKFVQMNTSGMRNRDLNERVSVPETILVSLLSTVLPPYTDSIQAAEFLRTRIGQNNPLIEWTAVRPDSLINADSVSPYTIHPSPVRSALFNPGKVSRINVARFMAELICDNNTWKRWKGQMPLIYSRETENK